MLKKNKSTTSATNNKKLNLRQWLKDAYYIVWTVVGLILIGAVVTAATTDTSLAEMTGSVPSQQSAQQPPAGQPAPPPPNQPTQEQLDCVGAEVGEERLGELQQGGQPNEQEAAVIQQCLQN